VRLTDCTACEAKTRGKCRDCGKPFCDRHRFIYVDESNEAITRNSGERCSSCYRIQFPNA
jgi:hypothetical protein